MKSSVVASGLMVVLWLVSSLILSRAAIQREAQSVTIPFSFQDVLWGGVENGTVFLEIPIADAFYSRGSTHYDRWRAFFDRVLLLGWRYSSERSLYWGTPVDPTYLNKPLIARAATFKLGMALDVRTPEQSSSAILKRYAVHCDDVGGGCVLLAIATPPEPLLDTRFLVSAADIPSCEGSCEVTIVDIEANVRKRIRDSIVAKLGLKHPSDSIPRFAREDVEIVAGSFTRAHSQQYVAYVSLYTEGEPSLGSWALALVDADLSIPLVLYQNGYSHVVPVHASDIDQDGLDEIWADFSGYEGGSTGLLFLEQGPPLRYGEIIGVYQGL